MKTQVGPHVLEIQDTGAPRGERNWWTVRLNGYTLYSATNGKKAQELHNDLLNALQDVQE